MKAQHFRILTYYLKEKRQEKNLAFIYESTDIGTKSKMDNYKSGKVAVPQKVVQQIVEKWDEAQSMIDFLEGNVTEGIDIDKRLEDLQTTLLSYKHQLSELYKNHSAVIAENAKLKSKIKG